jgi:hypothetical protein
MKDDTILILGGVGIGAFILYKSGIFKAVSGVSDVATTTTSAINTDIATFNQGLNEEMKNISTIFGNITGTISELTTQLKNTAVSTPGAVSNVISDVVKGVEDVITSGVSTSSAVLSGGGGGVTVPISQVVSKPTTGGYVVQTAQGGVSYATGTGPLSANSTKNIFTVSKPF